MSGTNTYVTYDLPGLFMPEQQTRVVESRDPQAAAGSAPAGAYAFTFHDQVTAIVDGVEFASLPRNRSGRYFINGNLHSVTDVGRMGPDRRVLLSNMLSNGWDWAVFCPAGNVQPFRDGDVVIAAEVAR